MTLTLLDYLIIGAYFATVIGIGFYFRKQAGKSLADYFISGRSLPWWIAGTSMVATTFAADTPLAVTGLVIEKGLAGNWVWWSLALGGMVTVFVYAKLWRRAEVMTDVELVEIRYGGKPAALLRGVRAIYVAFIVNSIIIGWVSGAMYTVLAETILKDVTGVSPWWVIFGTLAVVAIYGLMSGMWGVAIADVLQFCLAMFGCIALAYLAIDHFGGAANLENQVIENFGPEGAAAFDFIPSFTGDNVWLPLHVFLILLLVQWWATWYPGAEPGGGGYVVQRMAACRDERNSLLATLWYQVAHYCIRPWPWIIVAFAALAMYPELRAGELADSSFDSGVGFPRVMTELSPPGLRGLLIATFFAAFMSTISTQMNWGASYLVRDVYQRFVAPDASERQLTAASRWASLIVLCSGGVTSYLMFGVSVNAAWQMLLALGAGTGAVFMLRWFWWRINAWTEIASMVGSLTFFLALRFVEPVEVKMLYVALLTIGTWIVVMYLTPPEADAVLDRFYRKVRPGGSGWRPVAARNPGVNTDSDLGLSIVAAIFATGIVYSSLPAIGNLIFGHYVRALACGAMAVVCIVIVAILVPKLTRTDVVGGEPPSNVEL